MLIKNSIDVSYISHIIFQPFDLKDQYECLKQLADPKSMDIDFSKQLENKKIEMILGFNRKQIIGKRESFNENDIALETNLLVLIKLIHAIQYAINYESITEIIKEL